MDEAKNLGERGAAPAEFCDLDIPDSVLEKWQSIVDLIAKIGKVRSALIMRIRGEDLEVFVASRTENSPYRAGHRAPYLGSGLYCEQVLRQGRMLLVPNAFKSDPWKNNPDMKYHMRCYLGFPIRLPGGGYFGTICMLDDKENHFSQDMVDFMEKMRDLIESYLSLLQLSITDPLTRLYNRTYFDIRTEKDLETADREGQPLTALLLDVDRFKRINDTCGHLAGDRVLSLFAGLIRASLRSADSAFRFGGDEFCVLMPNTGADQAFAAAERLRATVESSRICSRFPVTTSIGVAQRLPGETVDRWISRADRALYKAKNATRNHVFR